MGNSSPLLPESRRRDVWMALPCSQTNKYDVISS